MFGELLILPRNYIFTRLDSLQSENIDLDDM